MAPKRVPAPIPTKEMASAIDRSMARNRCIVAATSQVVPFGNAMHACMAIRWTFEEKIMHISATGEGGFAGLSERYEIDTEAASGGKAIEAALDGIGFFAAKADATPDAIGFDLVRWRIAVSDGTRKSTVTFVEDGSEAAAPWQHLVMLIKAAQ
jgi:hypothetical protein